MNNNIQDAIAVSNELEARRKLILHLQAQLLTILKDEIRNRNISWRDFVADHLETSYTKANRLIIQLREGNL